MIIYGVEYGWAEHCLVLRQYEVTETAKLYKSPMSMSAFGYARQISRDDCRVKLTPVDAWEYCRSSLKREKENLEYSLRRNAENMQQVESAIEELKK